MAGLSAVYEFDIKKIIALSTLSQLGIIIFSISVGLYDLAFFHLLTHALFKALLFLCAGAVIHGRGSSQTVRNFGRIINNYPVIGVCLNLANLSLCGIPFLSGFYSKDIILELTLQNEWSLFLIILLIASVGLTVLYSFRLTQLTFISTINLSPQISPCDKDSFLLNPIISLTAAALISGPSLS